MKRNLATFVAAGLMGTGCQLPKPDARVFPAPSAVQLDRPAERKPASDTPNEIVTVAYADPQVLPKPREVDREVKPGGDPPAPPTDAAKIQGSPASPGGPLGLEEVLDAVERHYPLLRAVELERATTGGRLLTTLGAFDHNLTASAEDQGPATYENFRSTLGVSRGLPTGGVGVFAGYRTGYGDFPTYNLGQKTADGGEFRAGVSIPLLKDRAIDRPRAAVRQAGIDVALAEPTIERQRLDFRRAAARSYWNWVAAGQRLRVADTLLKLAVDRDEQLKARVAAGPAANIERVDNQQNIALRNGVRVQAERGFQQATIDLSLFLRDDTGTPSLAGIDRLPTFPVIAPVDAATFEPALRTAFDLRPEPRRIRLLRDKAAVDLALAENQILPSLNAVVAGSQDVGYSKSSLSGPNGLDRSSLNAGLTFALPVERRDALGRVATARAQLAQLEFQLRNAEDVVRADVQDTFSALERAHEFARQSKARVELARVVAEAEREQLRLGRSDVLRVTLREQAAFEAEVIEIAAQQDYFRAVADYLAALGIGGK